MGPLSSDARDVPRAHGAAKKVGKGGGILSNTTFLNAVGKVLGFFDLVYLICLM